MDNILIIIMFAKQLMLKVGLAIWTEVKAINWRDVWETTKKVAICYIPGFLTVKILWPILIPWAASTPVWLHSLAPKLTAFGLMWVVTHMEDNRMSPFGYRFLLSYTFVCLAFGFTTLFPSQYNEGMAIGEMAFVWMLIWKIFQKCRKDLKEARKNRRR
jgi:hypothetical protein